MRQVRCKKYWRPGNLSFAILKGCYNPNQNSELINCTDGKEIMAQRHDQYERTPLDQVLKLVVQLSAAELKLLRLKLDKEPESVDANESEIPAQLVTKQAINLKVL